MSKTFSWILLATLCLLSESNCSVLAKDLPINSKTHSQSSFYTAEAVEIEQMMNFRTLDSQYLHAKGLPLALKLLGMSYQSNGSQLYQEVESRIKAYKSSVQKPNALDEARAVLHAQPTDSDQVIKNRIAVVDLVIQMDPLEMTRNPHNPSRNVFMLIPH